MNRVHLSLLTGAATLLALSSCHSKDSAYNGEATQDVSVALPTTDSVTLYKSYPAYVQASSEADIVGRVNGYITEQLYDDGQWVAAGAPLFRIESTSYADKVQQAKAQLATAVAAHDYASKQYEAMKKALESDAVSKMEVIQAESNMHQAEASIQTAKAALQTANTMLGYCTVRAPFSGHVSAGELIPGDFVAGENSPVVLARIYDDNYVSVHFSIEDSNYFEISDTKSGKKVDLSHVPVTFSDSILTEYYGPVEYEAPGVDKSTGTIKLRVKLKNQNGELKSGMFATVKLPYAVDPKAIIIRDAAIGTDQLGKYVYVVNDSDKVVYTPIQVGDLYQDTLRIVSSGLKATDRYVTRAMLKVRDGMTVNPVQTPSATSHQTAAK